MDMHELQQAWSGIEKSLSTQSRHLDRLERRDALNTVRSRLRWVSISQIVPALLGAAVQPVVVGGQIELAHATGNRGAALDAHQPFVFAQVLADLAGHREQRAGGLFDLVAVSYTHLTLPTSDLV